MPAHTAIYTHSSMLKIFLLTHPREIAKVTNTGQLVIKALNCANSAKASAELILWSRTAPDPALLNSIATTPTLLLYPSEETLHNSSENNNPLADQQLPVSTTTLGQDRLDKATSVIVLDGTWQEVRKMYNKSHYLKSLNRLELASEKKIFADESMGGGSGMGFFDDSNYVQGTVIFSIVVGVGSAIMLTYYSKKRK